MQLRFALLPLLLAGAAAAQQTLPLLSAGGQYIWVPPPTSCGFFFDITINTTVTFQGVSFPTYTPVGSAAGMEMWITNTGITTHVGNEAIPATWTLMGSGQWTVPAAPTQPSVCFSSGVTKPPHPVAPSVTVMSALEKTCVVAGVVAVALLANRLLQFGAISTQP